MLSVSVLVFSLWPVTLLIRESKTRSTSHAVTPIFQRRPTNFDLNFVKKKKINVRHFNLWFISRR